MQKRNRVEGSGECSSKMGSGRVGEPVKYYHGTAVTHSRTGRATHTFGTDAKRPLPHVDDYGLLVRNCSAYALRTGSHSRLLGPAEPKLKMLNSKTKPRLRPPVLGQWSGARLLHIARVRVLRTHELPHASSSRSRPTGTCGHDRSSRATKYRINSEKIHSCPGKLSASNRLRYPRTQIVTWHRHWPSPQSRGNWDIWGRLWIFQPG